MLKISSRNEKLNRRMAKKETTHLLHKLLRCFFILTTKPKGFTPTKHPQKFLNFVFSKNPVFISQFQRYCIHWQSKLTFHSSFTKARTVCFLTGRSRSIYRAFKLSRLKIRTYAAAGYFIGLSKASW